MVTSWILNSLSPDLRDSLQYVNNAYELWAELEERYDQTNGCKLYQLQKEINDLVQGPLDITGYYTRMKKLWKEMSTIDVNSQCTCVCTCGGKTKLHKAEQDKRLIHFLMSLNEMYTSIRGNILMMSTLPSMAQSFAILSQEEKQREVKPNNHTVLDSTSLNAYGQSSNSAVLKDLNTNYSSTRGGGNNSGNFNNNNVFRAVLALPGPLCFVITARDQDTQMTGVTNFMATHPTHGFQKGRDQVQQKMCVLLR
ncbi:uncharacterized protein [Solanum tuberosum]|uniref:uncharacterized protein n=1 Tax=Solanum tuberosum TaxID=4113 RepID=UPI00073A48A9|nr:PREDICTED: uncharacterized protein LOC107061702 [Solanum tuberosum]